MHHVSVNLLQMESSIEQANALGMSEWFTALHEIKLTPEKRLAFPSMFLQHQNMTMLSKTHFIMSQIFTYIYNLLLWCCNYMFHCVCRDAMFRIPTACCFQVGLISSFKPYEVMTVNSSNNYIPESLRQLVASRLSKLVLARDPAQIFYESLWLHNLGFIEV